jgi:hypothetical protein
VNLLWFHAPTKNVMNFLANELNFIKFAASLVVRAVCGGIVELDGRFELPPLLTITSSGNIKAWTNHFIPTTYLLLNLLANVNTCTRG